MSREPLSTLYIEPPGPFWRRRLLLVLPLLAWLGVALPVVVVSSRDPDAVGLGLLLGLVCTGIALVLAYGLVLLRAGRELRDALAAWRANREAIGLLTAGEAAAAEVILRRCLARPAVPANMLPGLVHNLGVARLGQGDLPGARLLMELARASGWLDSFTYRKQRVGFAQGRILAAAVTGDLAQAEAELAGVEGLPVPAAYQPYLVLARAHLAARAGRHDDALGLMELLEGAELPPTSRRILDVLGAWCRVQLGEAPVEAIGGLALLEPGEPVWAAAWPELEAFVQELGLRRSPGSVE